MYIKRLAQRKNLINSSYNLKLREWSWFLFFFFLAWPQHVEVSRQGIVLTPATATPATTATTGSLTCYTTENLLNVLDCMGIAWFLFSIISQYLDCCKYFVPHKPSSKIKLFQLHSFCLTHKVNIFTEKNE